MRLWKWLIGWRYRTCVTCGVTFRRYPPKYPSLAGFSYCTRDCEADTWDDWVKKGVR